MTGVNSSTKRPVKSGGTTMAVVHVMRRDERLLLDAKKYRWATGSGSDAEWRLTEGRSLEADIPLSAPSWPLHVWVRHLIVPPR